MSIQKTIEGFLSAKAASAIVLQGKWGIGKTYFWQHRILRHAMGVTCPHRPYQ
ncbi:P-loop NTPase fold protein [Xanthomonas campestris]|uniref:P-loop NTPase fold protein n=1 Tax=Xanthomonas campestris TaxID=339 RepID=UPI0013B367CC|nr:P-loop NTPase fold protein [Xanthomonas campestris]